MVKIQAQILVHLSVVYMLYLVSRIAQENNLYFAAIVTATFRTVCETIGK